MKQFFLLPLLSLLFSSCIYIASTKTSYNHRLSEEAKARIAFVGKDSTFHFTRDAKINGKQPLFLMNGKQFRKTLAEGEWQVVYICLPYCPSQRCINVNEFCKMVRLKDAQPWIVLRDIYHDRVVQCVDELPLVGLDYTYYRKARCERKFFADMIGNVPDANKIYDSGLFFLFHGDKLVTQGNDLSQLLSHIPPINRVAQ